MDGGDGIGGGVRRRLQSGRRVEGRGVLWGWWPCGQDPVRCRISQSTALTSRPQRSHISLQGEASPSKLATHLHPQRVRVRPRRTPLETDPLQASRRLVHPRPSATTTRQVILEPVQPQRYPGLKREHGLDSSLEHPSRPSFAINNTPFVVTTRRPVPPRPSLDIPGARHAVRHTQAKLGRSRQANGWASPTAAPQRPMTTTPPSRPTKPAAQAHV